MLRYLLICITLEILRTQDINNELDKYRNLESFVELKGGDFIIGINDRSGVNYEHPQKMAHVDPFRILMFPVTNAAFRKFKDHKYKFRTDCEKSGFSWVFKSLKNSKAKIQTSKNIDDFESQEALKSNMLPIQEARWNKPEGGASSIRDKLNFPVVHVSYEDAFAFCAWKGMRLPTEIEWEYAARGDLHDKPYPWGERWQINRTNLWQGKFPEENQLRDGYYGLAPVDGFEAQNNFGIFDLLGNTWEWTSTIFRNPYKITDEKPRRRVVKGGSFLDTRDPRSLSEKMRIRISARMGRVENYTAQNLGFRCAQSIKPNEKTKFGDKNFRIVQFRQPKKFKPDGTHEEL